MALIKRRTTTTVEVVEEVDELPEPVELTKSGKGRATPKRNEARAARPRSRYALSGASSAPSSAGAGGRAGKGTAKEERRRRSGEYRQAMMSGDISKLPPRERAPERILARDYVDTRRNIGPYFLVIAALYFVGSLLPNAYARVATSYLMILALVAVVVDSFWLARQINGKIREKYPDSRVKVGLYSAQRALMPRRWRLPRPRVSR